MGFIPSIPHAAIPGGTLNSVGNSLTKTYDPNNLDLVDNAHKTSLKADQQSLFANRQVYVGVILRVDNNFITNKPDSLHPAAEGAIRALMVPTEGTPIKPKVLKVRVYIPELHAPKGIMTKTWPSGPNDHFTISQEYPEIIGARESLSGKDPSVGDCILVSLQDPKNQDILSAGNILGYAFENDSEEDILSIDVFGSSKCGEPRAAAAALRFEVRAAEREALPASNRARGINEENPDRPGNNRSAGQEEQNQEQQAEEETPPPNNNPGGTDGTPKCNKTYSVKGVVKKEEAHADLATESGGRKKQVDLWAWGKKRGTATVVRYQGRWITEELLTAFKKMEAAAKRDGIRLKINSAYRDPTDQRRLRRRFVNPKKKREFEKNGFVIDEVTGKKYTEFDTPEMIRMVDGRETRPNTFIMNASGKALKKKDKRTQNFDRAVGRPGMGGPGHHTGVAIDLSTGLGLTRKRLSGIKKKSPVYFWLALNAHKYGFVRNVPTERWHYHNYKRPVGRADKKINAKHWSCDDIIYDGDKRGKFTWATGRDGKPYRVYGL